MVCNQCGNPLPDHDNFCENCNQLVRPITLSAFLAQEDAKELKELPKDESTETQNISQQFITAVKKPENKILAIPLIAALALCVLLLIFVLTLSMSISSMSTPAVKVVSPTNVSASDVSRSDYIKYMQVGADNYGFTIVPQLWINAVYDSEAKELPSIQYVSVDGKSSVTLSKSYASEATLNKCAISMQEKMQTDFGMEEKEVKLKKTTVNGISAYSVTGVYKSENTPDCNLSSYLMMDENDNLYMLTLASYDDLSEISFILDNFSITDPSIEKEK